MKKNIELKEENIKRFYEEIALDKEVELVLKDIINSNISYSKKQNAVLISGESVNIRISKSGSMYFMLGKLYLKGSLRNKVLKLVVDNQLEELSELIELPRYIVRLMKSKFSGKEYVCWFNKNEEPIMCIIKETGLDRLKSQITEIEYRNLKEELNYISHIEKEPIFYDEKDEIYGDKPEDFISRKAELKEALQVVLDIRGSGRRIFAEELELLRELQSEIGNIIGE